MQPRTGNLGTARAPGGWGLVIGTVIAVSNDTESWPPPSITLWGKRSFTAASPALQGN